MPDSAIPTDDVERDLVEIETGIETDAAPAEISKRLQALSARAGPDGLTAGLDRLRFLIARATVENRLGLAGRAMGTLIEARRFAAAPEGLPFRSRISRAIATVHAWRGRGEQAKGELLRAVAEASAADSGADFAAAMAEAARVSQEIDRFDLALVFLDAALASSHLAHVERIRATVNRMQCLNRLGRHDECLQEIDATKAEPGWSQRRLLLRMLEKARALAAIGKSPEAQAALEEARRLLPSDPETYSHIDWTEASVEVTARDNPADVAAGLREMIASFAEDELHQREAGARLALSELKRQSGDRKAAFDEAVKALRIAVAENNSRMAERARSAIFRTGDGEAADVASPQLSERYILAEPLGRGGFGVVHRAIDLQTGEERAIKMVSLDGVADADRRERLAADARAEIEAASRLRHPGIVRIHHAFVSDGSIVIVQDLIRGRTLAALDRAGDPSALFLGIFAKLAHALVAMHESGVVHRDLKPSNVIVDERDRPVIIDFGLAAVAGERGDMGPARGTRNYVAPELLRFGEKPGPDPRQDIYAFGQMLEEFLPDRRQAGIIGLLGIGRADPLQNMRRAMLAPDPRQRLASLRAVAAELDRAQPS
ncbi:serine/threonine-protein kinase [Mesorhizobium sp. KR9-304]|uniref:serine/threonine-protein kinase n=1 Tax=Mesorhizobium sp. KR9-304 TaxID=3156614 RepID=UPI0032B5D797